MVLECCWSFFSPQNKSEGKGREIVHTGFYPKSLKLLRKGLTTSCISGMEVWI